VLDYRLVKTYFIRIFPVSSLSFFLLCLVISALNYVSVSFDISKETKVSEIKRAPLWIHLWDTCTLLYSVVCRQLLNTVQRSLL
jgi:hypothetical protein